MERTRMSKAAEPRGNAALPRFKVQGSRFSDQGQSDQRSMTTGRRSKVEGWARLLLTSDIILQTSYIFFEHPPSPSTLKGLHLSLVFSPLRGKKTAPPVALTLR